MKVERTVERAYLAIQIFSGGYSVLTFVGSVDAVHGLSAVLLAGLACLGILGAALGVVERCRQPGRGGCCRQNPGRW